MKAGELRLLYVETEINNEGKIRFIDDDPADGGNSPSTRFEHYVQVSVHVMHLKAYLKIPLSSRPNMRFIVTDSSEWMLVHLRNGPNPEITYMSPIETLKCDHPFGKSFGSVKYRELQ